MDERLEHRHQPAERQVLRVEQAVRALGELQQQRVDQVLGHADALVADVHAVDLDEGAVLAHHPAEDAVHVLLVLGADVCQVLLGAAVQDALQGDEDLLGLLLVAVRVLREVLAEAALPLSDLVLLDVLALDAVEGVHQRRDQGTVVVRGLVDPLAGGDHRETGGAADLVDAVVLSLHLEGVVLLGDEHARDVALVALDRLRDAEEGQRVRDPARGEEVAEHVDLVAEEIERVDQLAVLGAGEAVRDRCVGVAAEDQRHEQGLQGERLLRDVRAAVHQLEDRVVDGAVQVVEQAVHELRQEDREDDVLDVVLHFQAEVDLRQVHAGGLDVVVRQVRGEARLVALDGDAVEGNAGDDFEGGEDVLQVAGSVVPLPPEHEILVELLLRVVTLEGGVYG